MRTSTIVWIIVIILVVLGIWYWWAANQSSMIPSTATTAPSGQAGLNSSPNQTNTGQATAPTLLTITSSTALGNYLVASDGMTLYRYTKDTSGVSNCTGACATAWPPYIVSTNEPLLAGLNISGVLATITRADGSTQLTYKGVPLYFYANDAKPGDTTGQNVGQVWFVVKP